MKNPLPTSSTEQALGIVIYNFTKYLIIGSSGAEVAELQKFLIANGYAIPTGATGYFGSQTQAAVKAFQKAHTIIQTGTVGPLTRAELNKVALSSSGSSRLWLLTL